jgi:hypothetical protein
MTRIADVSRVVVPVSCADQTHAHLARVGRAGYEGLALWVGRQDATTFRVSETIIPEQRHIRTADGVCVIIAPEELHRLNVWLFRHKLALIGQIHSHPTEAYHSSTDDEYAIATTVGCFSLVVPDFARAPFDIGRNATYRLDGGGRWQEVAPRLARQIIRIEG